MERRDADIEAENGVLRGQQEKASSELNTSRAQVESAREELAAYKFMFGQLGDLLMAYKD